MDESKLRISTPSDLVTVVPYLLGFTPTNSLVVIGLRQRRVVFQLRIDLPEADEYAETSEYVAAVVARQGVTGALLVGYGEHETVAAVIDVVAEALSGKSIAVLEMLRVTDGRYWSYICTDPDCCPAEGTPIDPDSARVAAEATYHGLTASPNREAMAARLAPIEGEKQLEMTAAMARAEGRFARLVASERSGNGAAVAVVAGIVAVDEALVTVAGDAELSIDDVAWLGLLLVNTAVRDYVWENIGSDTSTHLRLWTDVTRRCDPALVAAPATLLAFAAYRSGEGPLAMMALERALNADPNYSMAHLLLQAIEGGISPTEYARLVDSAGATGRRSRATSNRRRSSGRHSARTRRGVARARG